MGGRELVVEREFTVEMKERKKRTGVRNRNVEGVGGGLMYCMGVNEWGSYLGIL